jgi:hypothetical protein
MRVRRYTRGQAVARSAIQAPRCGWQAWVSTCSQRTPLRALPPKGSSPPLPPGLAGGRLVLQAHTMGARQTS